MGKQKHNVQRPSLEPKIVVSVSAQCQLSRKSEILNHIYQLHTTTAGYTLFRLNLTLLFFGNLEKFLKISSY